MKVDRTKVVLRHLPPAMSQAALMEQIDGSFAGRYKWACFRPAKSRVYFALVKTWRSLQHDIKENPLCFKSLSICFDCNQKNQRYSRVYIDFMKLEDAMEFAEFFSGHIFVNEKGAQFKALVEYAPSQRVPTTWLKKDGREGTIFKDPEYLEFLEHLVKPVENLPSAEIQLERREAERAGGPKEIVVVTPLMEFVRQKRAAKSGPQRSSASGKVNRRARGASSGSFSTSSKRGSEKRRVPNSMHVLRDSTKNGIGKDKPTYMLVPRREQQLASLNGAKKLEDGNVSGGNEPGKRGTLLLRGKEKEISHASIGSSQQLNVTSMRNLPDSTAVKPSHRNEINGRIIRGILSKDSRCSQPNLAAYQSELKTQALQLEKDKRPPRPPNSRSILKDIVTGSHKPGGHLAVAHGSKEIDASLNFSEGKSSKRGSTGYGSHERQVWVQKSGSG